MPHYADGTEAKVGDVVKGKPYNTPCEVVGTIVRITPGSESCNCTVAFIKATRISKEKADLVRSMQLYGVVQLVLENDGGEMLVQSATDYGETKAFTKVG